jgi:putative transposase
MKSKLVAQLLADLGVVKTHSRPYTSDDNPFSEAHFKTLKYCPSFPKNFGSLEDARAFCRQFFKWYNQEHRHSGINWLTPETVHYGESDRVLLKRDIVLSAAFEKYPARFKHKQPSAGTVPDAVWINPPKLALKGTAVAA